MTTIGSFSTVHPVDNLIAPSIKYLSVNVHAVVWAYNIEEGKWRTLPGCSKLAARGGPGLVVTDNRVRVVFGFDGKNELSDVHCFDLDTNVWEEVETSGEKPSPRSVVSYFAQGKYIVVYGGEVNPSDLGHIAEHLSQNFHDFCFGLFFRLLFNSLPQWKPWIVLASRGMCTVTSREGMCLWEVLAW